MSAPAPADLVVSGIGTVLPPAAAPAGGDWFDYRTELAPRGYKYVPRPSQYLLAAGKQALAELGADLEDDRRAGCGVALGSNNCASRLHGDIDRKVREAGIGALQPATVPYFSVNVFLSRLAIEHRASGFSLALHTPRTAGLESVLIGGGAVAAGRARWLLAGATEQPLDEVEPAAAESEDGAVVLVLEPAADVAARGGRSYGRCRVVTCFVPPSSAATGRADAVSAVAARLAGLGDLAGVPARLVGDDSAVSAAVAAALGPAGCRAAAVSRVDSGPGCLRPLVEVADALRGGVRTLVAAATATGYVAAALVEPSG